MIENHENASNAKIIYSIISSNFGTSAKVIDICCGVYDDEGINYDLKGDIYQPIVANYLAQKGLEVTGIDTRENKYFANLHYNHRSDIDILESNWPTKLKTKFDVAIFLRSWDTPEILLHYQDKLQIHNLNKLCLEIAKIYLPQFKSLIKPGGLFFTTDICNYSICNTELEVNQLQQQIGDLLLEHGFKEIYSDNGLYGYQI